MKHYKRGFLNIGEGMAAFEHSLTYENEDYSYASIDANFCITDCSRKVSLDFYTHDNESFENSLHKVRTLIQELQEFGEMLIAANMEMEAIKANRKKSDETS